MSQRPALIYPPDRHAGNEFFREMIDQLAPELLYLTFYFQGEPYLNPAFLDMVQYAFRKENIHSHLHQCALFK